MPQVPTILYPEEGDYESYTGSIVGSQPHGLRILELNDGKICFDHFESGKMLGFGAVEYPKSSDIIFYSGNFHNNQYSGNGAMKWRNGDFFVGENKNGTCTGYGVYIYNNGDIYKGIISNGNFNGSGNFYWSNGFKYVGEWLNGTKHGLGRLTYYQDSNAVTYVGYFENNVKSGRGILKWRQCCHLSI